MAKINKEIQEVPQLMTSMTQREVSFSILFLIKEKKR